MSDTKLLIVADDLTGGLDTGVQFTRQGITVRVVVDPDPSGKWTRTAAFTKRQTRLCAGISARNSVRR